MKIKFQPYTETDVSLLKPSPAVKILPDWYKKLSPYTEGDKPKFFADGGKNITIKRCNPVGDAFGLGYFLILENDISVTPKEEGNPELVWHRGGNSFVSTHGKIQIDEAIVPKGFSDQPFKFKNDWSIQTPKGYSVLITHPLNKNAEPFFTLSGVVDTDTYHTSIQLPFLVRNDFEGIIEAGTPIAQVVPFKRESWNSEILKFDEGFYSEKEAAIHRTMSRFYKRFHWKRKEYK